MISKIAHVSFDHNSYIEPKIQNNVAVLDASNILVDDVRNTYTERSMLHPYKLNGWILFSENQIKNQFKVKPAMRSIKDLISANMDVFVFYQDIVLEYNILKAFDPDFNFATYHSTYPAELTADNIVTLLERSISAKTPTFSITEDNLNKLVNSYDVIKPDSLENMDLLGLDGDEFHYIAEIYFTLSLNKSINQFDEIISLNVRFVDAENEDIFSFASTEDWLNDKVTMQNTWREYSVRMRTKYFEKLNSMKTKIEELING